MTGTDDLILLFRARVLMIGRREVLSAFEIQTIREADARVRSRQGVVTPAERTVIEDAVAAMLAAGCQQTHGRTSPA